MAREIRINYLNATALTWERYDLACDQLGWANKSLVQQCIHAFFAKHQMFYSQAGIKDALARGMEVEEYYQALRDRGELSLPSYVHGRPGFGVTPLDSIEEPEQTFQRRYNRITLSNYNYVLIQVARIVDTGPMIGVASKIVQHHFDTYWERNYLPQIDRDQRCSFT